MSVSFKIDYEIGQAVYCVISQDEIIKAEFSGDYTVRGSNVLIGVNYECGLNLRANSGKEFKGFRWVEGGSHFSNPKDARDKAVSLYQENFNDHHSELSELKLILKKRNPDPKPEEDIKSKLEGWREEFLKECDDFCKGGAPSDQVNAISQAIEFSKDFNGIRIFDNLHSSDSSNTLEEFRKELINSVINGSKVGDAMRKIILGLG